MKIKLKNICVDINNPKSIDKLRELKDVCEKELKSCNKIQKGFILFILQIVTKKLNKLALDSVKTETTNISSY